MWGDGRRMRDEKAREGGVLRFYLVGLFGLLTAIYPQDICFGSHSA